MSTFIIVPKNIKYNEIVYLKYSIEDLRITNIECDFVFISVTLFLEYIEEWTSFYDMNKDVPAIIVSAGPSLDKNLAEMINYKDKLKDYFIIAGNRTLKTLINNNIKPDLLVTVDPNEITHEMINSSNYNDIPIVSI